MLIVGVLWYNLQAHADDHQVTSHYKYVPNYRQQSCPFLLLIVLEMRWRLSPISFTKVKLIV